MEIIVSGGIKRRGSRLRKECYCVVSVFCSKQEKKEIRKIYQNKKNIMILEVNTTKEFFDILSLNDIQVFFFSFHEKIRKIATYIQFLYKEYDMNFEQIFMCYCEGGEYCNCNLIGDMNGIIPIKYPFSEKEELFFSQLLKRFQNNYSLNEVGCKTGFYLQYENENRYISFQSILYIEANLRTVILHTKEQEIPIRMNFSEIKEYMPSNVFLQTHRSCLVNRIHIYYIHHDENTNTNTIYFFHSKKTAYLSRTFKKELKEELAPYFN